MKLKEAIEKVKLVGPAQAGHINAMIARHYDNKFEGLVDFLNACLDSKTPDELWDFMVNNAPDVVEDAEEVEGI